jgi:UDP-N-acetylglucosamine 2-epimerase (non-hydrolysing)
MNPYGDGQASQRIVAALSGAAVSEFQCDQRAAA